MLVTFQSPATSDALALREFAQYLLGGVGKQLEIPGVIQLNELPGAISRLEMAISDEEKAEIAADALNYVATAGACRRGNAITQCAWRLLDMMKQADLSQADVICDVRHGWCCTASFAALS